ncbi:hypothetical protein QR680_016780 [Steinernema hermaphroditum]|uniref:Uncharacterized protein n=1 Tax=Steinernema hermaphroditum TaxID=289476 RepID=A0AA39HCA0_9BILA|nr:hypothetical protein QR680_016780 [Steinernema hermaphroditum]
MSDHCHVDGAGIDHACSFHVKNEETINNAKRREKTINAFARVRTRQELWSRRAPCTCETPNIRWRPPTGREVVSGSEMGLVGVETSPSGIHESVEEFKAMLYQMQNVRRKTPFRSSKLASSD